MRFLRQTNLELEYVGQTDRPFTAADITANAFRIVLRDLEPGEARQYLPELDLLQRDGLPDYFDQQRFGSLGRSGEFIGRAWCGGDYERALWLALAEPRRARSPPRAARPAKCSRSTGATGRGARWPWGPDRPARSPSIWPPVPTISAARCAC